MDNWIARERLMPLGADRAWWFGLLGIAAAAGLLMAALGTTPTSRFAAEETYRNSDGFVQALQAAATVTAARLWSSIAGAVAVLATGIVARRLLHADLPSLMAAALVAIDPGMLVHGRMATPVAPATAAALLGLALFLHSESRAHWWGAAAFAYACFMEPTTLLWSPVLAVMVLARGHIYAAPRHAGEALLQTIVVPALGAVVGILGVSSLDDGCYMPARGDALLLRSTVDLGGIWAAPNVVTWFAGLGALLFLGGWAIVHVCRDFRLQRLPGRVQLRLSAPLRRVQSRGLWLLGLALLAPTPVLLMPIAAVALAAGVQELGKDSRAFGIVVGAIVLVFAAAVTVQGWDVLVAEATVPQLPWMALDSC